MSGRRALYLDLGDTLVRVEDDEIYTDGNAQVELLPRRKEILQSKARGFEVVFIVTNQAGIDDGIVSVDESASFIGQVDATMGGLITDYWACPRRDSSYRKPNPGMIIGLADKHYVDLSTSVFLGDSESDRAAADAAGVEFILASAFFADS